MRKIATTRMFDTKFLINLVVPLLIEQVLTLTIGMADTIMVANVGEVAVSGISLVDSLSNLFVQIFAAFATGGAVVSSQYLGRKDKKSAREAAKQLIYITSLFSLAIMLIGLILNRNLLSLIFGQIESAVMENASIYFIFILISYPFLAVTNSANALCRSMGMSTITMAVSFVMNLINIGGNAFLIYAVGLGAAGAGIASLASRVVGCVIMLKRITNPNLEINASGLFKFAWKGDMIKRIWKISLPSGIENSMFQIGKVLVQSLVASFGTASIAANAVVNNISSFANLPGSVLNLASITIIGQCCGAGRYDQAKWYGRRIMLSAYLMVDLCSLFFYVFTPSIAGFYNLSPEAEALAIRCTHLLLVQIALFWPLSFTTPNYLRAAGDARYTMTVSMCSMWIFRVMLSHLLGNYFGMGLIGTIWAMCIDWYCRIIFFVTRWARGKWVQNKVI